MALTTNGTSQYLSAGPEYNFGATCTSISWWNQRSVSVVNSDGMGRSNAGGDRGWLLCRTNTTDNSEFKVTMLGGSGSSAWTIGGSWSLNTWRHFLYVFVASGNHHYLYEDGTLISDNTAAGAYGTALTGIPLYVGASNQNGTPTGYFGGKTAELAIWDNVDVSSLVGQLRTGATAGKAPNNIGSDPTYYWPLISNGNATLGGVNFTDNASPGWDSSAHTGLTITYASGAAASSNGIIARVVRRIAG